MYTPQVFADNKHENLIRFIRQNSFGVLVSTHSNELEATHLPFMFDETIGKQGALIGHFAKANAHWKTLHEDIESLAIFSGAHAYVSPEWYNDGEMIPTWNYATVHVKGCLELNHDPEFLKKIVLDLVHVHEKKDTARFAIEDHLDVVERLLPGIVGFTMPITSMQGKFKFNQNRSTKDQQGVVDALSSSRNSNEQGVAEIMQQLLCPQHSEE